MSDAKIAAVAARQAGAFSVEQAADAGFSSAVRRQNILAGRWIRLYRGVLAIAGSPDTPERRLWAAKLALGPCAVASHRSALWPWDIGPSKDLDVVEFTLPLSHSARRPGVVVHRVADFARVRVSIRRGIATTSPMRALVDAAAVVSTAEVEDAFDRAVARKLVSPPAVLAEIRRVPGRPGIGALRRVLLDQGVGSKRSPSYLEAKALRLFRRAGLPRPVVELTWGDHGQFRLDFIWPEYGVVVEVDGWDCHSSARSRQYDLHRRNQVVLGGLRHLSYTYGDIIRRGETVAREIRQAMAPCRPGSSVVHLSTPGST